MKQKLLAMALITIMTANLLTGCGSSATTPTSEPKFQMLETDLKVGMVTDAGTIDDRSFNQGTWEGIKDTVKNAKYLKPDGVTDADYETGITNLYDGNYKFIVTPGFKFERAIATAQEKYPDAKFVLIDGTPKDSQNNEIIGENTVCIFFAEQEAGFISGIAAATELKNSEFGFIGGMQLPSVERFNWGFQQGIKYANENLGTNITIKKENVIYQGSFDDKAGGQQIAAQMYDRGVKVIFTPAAGTGVGVITEAKSRATNGDTSVFVIGADIDQYQDGVYDTENNASVILTSAIKCIDQASHDMIKAEVEGNFPNGQIITFSIANNGVGIPAVNPNLSEDTIKTVNDVYTKIKTGEITVMDSNDGSLIK